MNKVQNDILETIKQYDRIIIHRHQRPDPDAFGSQLGLREILRTAFPEKTILAVGSDNPGLDWIGQMDYVKDEDYDQSLVIITDTANLPRVDDDRYPMGRTLIKIDHHPNEEPYGDLQWVEPQASSSSELITRFVLESEGELRLTDTSAKMLYAGFAGDTGRFMYATNADTLRIAANLYDYKIDAEGINRHMTSVTEAQARFGGLIEQKMTIEDGLAYIVLTRPMIEAANLGTDGTGFVVGIPGRIDTVQVWAIFEEQPDGEPYRVRLRSKGTVISGVAAQHDGGGHDQASGAKAKDEQEIQTIIKELKALL